MPNTDPPSHGTPVALAPGLRRIIAPNPSPMTLHGTNTYLLGDREIAVIDPGPDHAGHLSAILAALAPGQRITHVIVSHSHLDHAPLARPLAALTGAPVLAFGDATAGRSEIMTLLAQGGLLGGGEGVDLSFVPDRCLHDGDRLSADGWTLEVLHTPGHLGNHICLAWEDSLFTADHVMGWASSLVSPPDGDLTDFMRSCARLQARQWRRFFPGHGDPVEDPSGRLSWLVEHRRAREHAILDALRAEPGDAMEITARVYTDTPTHLLPAARRNVIAHLIDLHRKSLVAPLGALSAQATFALVQRDPEQSA